MWLCQLVVDVIFPALVILSHEVVFVIIVAIWDSGEVVIGFLFGHTVILTENTILRQDTERLLTASRIPDHHTTFLYEKYSFDVFLMRYAVFHRGKKSTVHVDNDFIDEMRLAACKKVVELVYEVSK